MKLTGAAILVSRGMKVLQAAPAAYPYRSPAEGDGGAVSRCNPSGWFARTHVSRSCSMRSSQPVLSRLLTSAVLYSYVATWLVAEEKKETVVTAVELTKEFAANRPPARSTTARPSWSKARCWSGVGRT